MIVLSLPIMIVATCLSVLLAYCVHLNTVYTLLFSKVKQKRDYFCLIARSGSCLLLLTDPNSRTHVGWAGHHHTVHVKIFLHAGLNIAIRIRIRI